MDKNSSIVLLNTCVKNDNIEPWIEQTPPPPPQQQAPGSKQKRVGISQRMIISVEMP